MKHYIIISWPPSKDTDFSLLHLKQIHRWQRHSCLLFPEGWNMELSFLQPFIQKILVQIYSVLFHSFPCFLSNKNWYWATESPLHICLSYCLELIPIGLIILNSSSLKKKKYYPAIPLIFCKILLFFFFRLLQLWFQNCFLFTAVIG